MHHINDMYSMILISNICTLCFWNSLVVGERDEVCEGCQETAISDHAENSKRLVSYIIEELTIIDHINETFSCNLIIWSF